MILPVLATYSVSFFIILGRSPRISGAGLDPSWKAAVAEATARGWGFGTDIIFTFGPYASVLTGEFHPLNVHLTFLAASLLSLSMGFFLNQLRRGGKGQFWIFVSLVLLLNPISYEYFLLSILALSLVLVMINSAPNYISHIWLIPFALFPLIKGSMAVGYFSFGGLFLVWLISQKRFLAFAITLMSQIAAIALFWSISGQRLLDLPAYARGIYSLSEGYSSAMSIPGNFSELIVSVMLFLALVVFIGLDVLLNRRQAWAIALMLIFFLFLAFKSGFVRHDLHALHFAYTALAVVALWGLVRSSNTQDSLKSLLVPFMIASVVISNHTTFNPISRVEQIYSDSSSAFSQFLQPSATLNHLQQSFDTSRSATSEQYDVDNFCKGASDIYPWEASALIPSQSWKPRPVFQSYTVYTEYLRNSNLRHLQSRPKGDRVIFSNTTIDGRLPLSMEPAAAYFFRSNYSIIGESSLGLCLEKNANENTETVLNLDQEARVQFGEEFTIDSNHEHFTSMKLQPERSIFSKLFGLVYRPSFIYVTLNFEGGESARYRFIPTDESEFVPIVIGSSAEVEAFLNNEKPSKVVESIMLEQEGAQVSGWGSNVLVSISN